MGRGLLAGAVALALLGGVARAQVVVSANDAKQTLENGTLRNILPPQPDSLTVLEFSGPGVRMRGQAAVPTSVGGPPLTVAISPDEKLAVVSANQVWDANDPAKLSDGRFLTVVDIGATPPRVVGQVPTGAAPAGLSFTPDGKLLLVANRGEGSVGVYRVAGETFTDLGRISLGNAASLVSHVAVTPDGKHALVTRYGDAMVQVLDIDGEQVRATPRQITVGVNPYGLSITPDGKWAVVANVGRGTGDADTVSLIDLQRPPFRVVDTITVGQTPEGIMVSPDNRHVAVTVMNGSNKPRESPFFGPGQVKMLRIENGRLRVVATARVGTWSQGAAFSRDGRTLLVGNMVERTIQVFRFEQDQLRDTGQVVRLEGGSAALRSSAPGR